MGENMEREVVDLELTEEQLDAILDGMEADTIDDVSDRLFEERIIYLNGSIDEEAYNNIVPLIKYFNIQDDRDEIEPSLRKPLKLYINSEGGEAYNGLGILNSIESSATPVWTYNEGTISYSMAFLLFLAGHKRHMGRFSFLLYHELRGASDTKTLAETETMLQHYKQMQSMMDNYIVERTSIPLKKLKEMRRRNTDWYIDYNLAKRYSMFDESL